MFRPMNQSTSHIHQSDFFLKTSPRFKTSCCVFQVIHPPTEYYKRRSGFFFVFRVLFGNFFLSIAEYWIEFLNDSGGFWLFLVTRPQRKRCLARIQSSFERNLSNFLLLRMQLMKLSLIIQRRSLSGCVLVTRLLCDGQG